MKDKAKNRLQQANQVSSTKKSPTVNHTTWEMSAQEALRVDYLTHYRKL